MKVIIDFSSCITHQLGLYISSMSRIVVFLFVCLYGMLLAKDRSMCSDDVYYFVKQRSAFPIYS